MQMSSLEWMRISKKNVIDAMQNQCIREREREGEGETEQAYLTHITKNLLHKQKHKGIRTPNKCNIHTSNIKGSFIRTSELGTVQNPD